MKIKILFILILINTISAYDESDFFIELVYNTDYCLNDCYAIYKFCNPTNISIFPYMIQYSFKYSLLSKNNYVSNINRQINSSKIDKYLDHFLKLNKSKIIYNSTLKKNITEYYIDTISIYKNYTKEFYRPINVLDYLNPNQCVYIKINGSINLNTEIDWMPEITINTINYKQKKWYWWNSSFPYSYKLNCTNITDLLPIAVNNSGGFNISNVSNINANITMWSYCSGDDTRLYFINQTDYLIANSTTQLFFDTETGTVTSYNTPELWNLNGDAVMIYHYNSTSNDSSIHDRYSIETNFDGDEWVPGKFGYGIELEQERGEYIDIDDFNWDGTRNWTAMVWIKTNDSDTHTQPYNTGATIFGDGGGGERGEIGLSGGNVSYGWFDGVSGYNIMGTINVSDDIWHHIVVTNENLSDSLHIRIYVDGKLDNNGSTTQRDNEDLSLIRLIGHGFAALFNGTLDEIRFFDNITYTADMINQTYLNENNSVSFTGYGNLEILESIGTISIFNVSLSPLPNITYFDVFNVSANVTISDGDVDNVTAYLRGINGDGLSCYQFYPNGTCLLSDNITKNLFNYSSNQIFYNDTIDYHEVFLGIEYTLDSNYHNNAPEFIDIYKSSYHILNFTNNFTVGINTTIKIDVDVREKFNTNKDIRIYLIGNQVGYDYFTSDWRTKENTTLIRSIPISTSYDYIHDESRFYQVILESNNSGLFTSNGLNLSNVFYIVIYSDGGASINSWNMSFLNTTFPCKGNWYIGSTTGWSLTLTTGCPSVHTHFIRNTQNIRDGINVTVIGNTTSSTINLSNALFYYLPLANLPPLGASFLSPENGTYINGTNIDFNITACIDPNGDNINYTMNLTNVSNLVVIYNLVNNSENLSYTINSSLFNTTGNFTIIGICCDPFGLCSVFNHSSEWISFEVATTATTTTTIPITATEFNIIIFDVKNILENRRIYLYEINLSNNLYNGTFNFSQIIKLNNGSSYNIVYTPSKYDAVLNIKSDNWVSYVIGLSSFIILFLIFIVIYLVINLKKKK